MRVLVVGCGVVGVRAVRQLLSVDGIDSIVIDDIRTGHSLDVVRSMGSLTTRRVYRTVRTYRTVPVYRQGRAVSMRRVSATDCSVAAAFLRAISIVNAK